MLEYPVTYSLADLEQFYQSIDRHFGPKAFKMMALFGHNYEKITDPEQEAVRRIFIAVDHPDDMLPVNQAKDFVAIKKKTGADIHLLYINETRYFAQYYPLRFFLLKKNAYIFKGKNIFNDFYLEWRFFKEAIERETARTKTKLRRVIILSGAEEQALKKELANTVHRLMVIMKTLVDTPESKLFNEDDQFYDELHKLSKKIDALTKEEILDAYRMIFGRMDMVLREMHRI